MARSPVRSVLAPSSDSTSAHHLNISIPLLAPPPLRRCLRPTSPGGQTGLARSGESGRAGSPAAGTSARSGDKAPGGSWRRGDRPVDGIVYSTGGGGQPPPGVPARCSGCQVCDQRVF